MPVNTIEALLWERQLFHSYPEVLRVLVAVCSRDIQHKERDLSSFYNVPYDLKSSNVRLLAFYKAVWFENII